MTQIMGTVGMVLWVLAGAAALLVALALPFPHDRWLKEAIVALVTAFVAGVFATALDFGGWREVEWRAGLFAFALALAAIGWFRVLASPAPRVSESADETDDPRALLRSASS